MKIREAILRDVNALAFVHVESWKTTYTGLMPDEAISARPIELRRQQWQRNLGSEKRKAIDLVAELNSEIVGFVNGSTPQSPESDYDCELYAIYLLKEAHGKGIGRQLMISLVERLHNIGYKTMVLSVLKENTSSSGFYVAMGGEIVSEGAYSITEKIRLATLNYGWQDIRTILVER